MPEIVTLPRVVTDNTNHHRYLQNQKLSQPTTQAETMMKRASLFAAAILLWAPVSFAQSTRESYRATCTIKSTDLPASLFHCRWMQNGETGRPIFVDNGDTNERYIVNGSGDAQAWTFKSRNGCIATSAMAGGETLVCLGDQRKELNASSGSKM
ncbi:MAG: hypothetical protein ACKOHJ_08960 [Vulcanococcus sp.]